MVSFRRKAESAERRSDFKWSYHFRDKCHIYSGYYTFLTLHVTYLSFLQFLCIHLCWYRHTTTMLSKSDYMDQPVISNIHVQGKTQYKTRINTNQNYLAAKHHSCKVYGIRRVLRPRFHSSRCARREISRFQKGQFLARWQRYISHVLLCTLELMPVAFILDCVRQHKSATVSKI